METARLFETNERAVSVLLSVQTTMSISQYILLTLIIITTWAAWLEWKANRPYIAPLKSRVTALVLPTIFGLLIIFPGWLVWFGKMVRFVPHWILILFVLFVAPIAMILSIIVVPALFVTTIFLWVTASLDGELKTLLQTFFGNFIPRFMKRS